MTIHKKILLVEDEKIAQLVGKENLQELGFEVDIATSGVEALTLTSKHLYGLIFMDIGLPDIDGFELTKKIRAHGFDKNVPIIALTAHRGKEYQEKAEQYELNDFYIKPLTIENIKKIFSKFKLI